MGCMLHESANPYARYSAQQAALQLVQLDSTACDEDVPEGAEEDFSCL